MAAKTKKYELTGVKHQGFNEEGERVEFSTGDMVPLTDAQYENFKDKFKAPKEQTKAEEKAGLAPNEKPLTATQPQDAVDPGKQVEAPKADETKPQDGKTGAGASENSTNTVKK
jgi:hypothetical protein